MKKRFLAFALVLVMLLPLAVSCKKDKEENSNTDAVTVDTSDGYDYGTLDCGGDDFTFLQCDEGRWNMKTALAPTEIGSDEISNAVYSRNETIKSLYNVNIKCINEDIYETGTFIRTQCSSGDQSVDVAYVIGSSVPALMTEACLNDIASTPNIQIYEPWWGQTIRESSQFRGSSELYFAQCDISLTAFELTWCIGVNLDMIEVEQLENPYELVKNNQWTMEKMFTMAKNAMKKNTVAGVSDYDYREDTDCVLGIATYNNFTVAALNGANCFLTKKDATGTPVFSGEGERFIDVVTKWYNCFATPGMAVDANETGFHYEKIFSAGRSLFVGTELKGTTTYRSSDVTYGIVPVPTYEEGEEYHSTVNYLAPVLVIPKTNDAGEKTGRILDTMAYMSYKNILPLYYETNLSYKALQDPESIEMLDIIRDTRCFETSLLFGWTTDFYESIRNVVVATSASSGVSSIISSNRKKVNSSIKSYFETLDS